MKSKVKTTIKPIVLKKETIKKQRKPKIVLPLYNPDDVSQAITRHAIESNKDQYNAILYGTNQKVICTRSFVDEDEKGEIYDELCGIEWTRPMLFGNLYPRAVAWACIGEVMTSYKNAHFTLDPWLVGEETHLNKLVSDVNKVTGKVWDKCLLIQLSNDSNIFMPGQQKLGMTYHEGFQHWHHNLACIIIQIGEPRNIQIKKDRARTTNSLNIMMNDGDLIYTNSNVNENCRHGIPEDDTLIVAKQHSFFLFLYEAGSEMDPKIEQ